MADLHDGPVLIVDLDGTLYRGDGPVRHYAAGLAAALTPDDRRAVLDEVAAYLAGRPGALAGAPDGWVAARLAADRRGVTDAAVTPAFLAARHALADGSCRVEPATPLIELLRALAPGVHRVLMTNSPDDGLAALLARLDATDVVDRVVSSAAKPVGLEALLAEVLPRAGASHRVLSVGDHWHNDIAPVLAVGGIGAYVDTHGRREGPAHLSGARVEQIVPGLAAWAADPERFATTHDLGTGAPHA